MDTTTFVGLDSHKATITGAALLPGKTECELMQIANEPGAIRRLSRKLLRLAPGKVVCCYEAGPCGYTLQRELHKNGVECSVVAPSMIPVKPGARVKTDRRDARKLAGLLRAGLLTVVHPPTLEEEAVRDLCRCRLAAVVDARRHQQQLLKFLLRRQFVYTAGKATWTQAHMAWLRKLRFDLPADQITFEDILASIDNAVERVRTLEAKIEEFASRDPYREPVAWLRCFRGIKTTTAMIIVTEIHDIRRFEKARHLMAYLGLVPSEHSSGEKELRGGLTKAGNVHVRRILIEAAWNYRRTPAPSSYVNARREGQPAWVVQIARKAEQRLHRKYWKLEMGGKPSCKAAAAVARELVGFLWAVLTRPGGAAASVN